MIHLSERDEKEGNAYNKGESTPSVIIFIRFSITFLPKLRVISGNIFYKVSSVLIQYVF